MPVRIEDALNFPVVREVIATAGEKNVRKYVHYELIKLSALVSVGGNLNDMQADFIAQELIRLFPNETLADFKLCFQRGAIGQYGEIFRLDGIVIRGWMEKYLTEKYQVIETQLREEKDTEMYRPSQTLTEEARRQKDIERLKEWRKKVESVEGGMKQVPEVDAKSEGQQKPKRQTYNNGLTIEQVMKQQALRRAASEFYKGRTTFKLKMFIVEGNEIMAESEQDAQAIYSLAK